MWCSASTTKPSTWPEVVAVRRRHRARAADLDVALRHPVVAEHDVRVRLERLGRDALEVRQAEHVLDADVPHRVGDRELAEAQVRGLVHPVERLDLGHRERQPDRRRPRSWPGRPARCAPRRARLCGRTTRCVTRRVVGSTTRSASSPNSASAQWTALPRSSRCGAIAPSAAASAAGRATRSKGRAPAPRGGPRPHGEDLAGDGPPQDAGEPERGVGVAHAEPEPRARAAAPRPGLRAGHARPRAPDGIVSVVMARASRPGRTAASSEQDDAAGRAIAHAADMLDRISALRRTLPVAVVVAVATIAAPAVAQAPSGTGSKDTGESANIWDGFLGFLGWVLLVLAVAGFLIWMLLGRRRDEAEDAPRPPRRRRPTNRRRPARRASPLRPLPATHPGRPRPDRPRLRPRRRRRAGVRRRLQPLAGRHALGPRPRVRRVPSPRADRRPRDVRRPLGRCRGCCGIGAGGDDRGRCRRDGRRGRVRPARVRRAPRGRRVAGRARRAARHRAGGAARAVVGHRRARERARRRRDDRRVRRPRDTGQPPPPVARRGGGARGGRRVGPPAAPGPQPSSSIS